MSHSPPRIGYVCKRYPRFSETFIVNEILAHEAAGTEIEIFALRPVQETHFQDQIARVRAPVTRIQDKVRTPDAFHRLLLRTVEVFPDAVETLLSEAAASANLAQGMELALACHEKEVAHLHAHFGTVATTVARLAARIAGITYSFTAHAKDIYHDYDTPVALGQKMRDAAAVITVSDYNLDHLSATFGMDARNAVRIYNGLDLTRFDWHEPATKATEILAVGRLVEKKGFHILIEALLLMQEAGHPVRCRIVGQGEEGENLRHQIAAAGLEGRVTLEGPLPQSQVIELMRRAAVLACPCIVGHDGNRDGLPTVLLEAMALGTPCISTDVTGIPELVRDGDTGLCVAEGDPKALADGLTAILSDAELRDRLSRAGRALIEAEFDVGRSAAALRTLFAQAVANEGSLRGVA